MFKAPVEPLGPTGVTTFVSIYVVFIGEHAPNDGTDVHKGELGAGRVSPT